MSTEIHEDIPRFASRDKADMYADIRSDQYGAEFRVYKVRGQRTWLVSGDIYWEALAANPEVEYVRTADME